MRLALGLEYDGRGFCGWQTQPGGCSVQDALERALAVIAGHRVATVCAGRTDAGVHASLQVVHFDTGAQRPLSAWIRGVNAHLAAGISVLWARPVPAEFHARHHATARRYRYRLLTRPSRPGLEQGRAGWWPGQLDVEAMRAASACLVGRHDFSAFRAAQCQAASPVRTVESLELKLAGTCLHLDIVANAFLHHMVRNIVGSLVYVGAGRHPPGWIETVLAGRDRRLAAPTFAPDGLHLTGVRYDPALGLDTWAD